MHRPLSLALALLLVCLSAVATALAFPPWSLRPLAFVSLVPLLLAIRSGGLGRALGLAMLWCVLFAWSIASVFPASLAEYYERPLWFGVLIAMLAFLSMAAVYYAAFAAVDRIFVRRPAAWTPLIVAAAWVAAELGRGRLFTGTPFFIGNPWGLLGYTHTSGALAQLASLAGVYGIAFALVAVNAGLAGVIGAWPRREARRTAAAGLGLSLLPVILAAIHGAVVLSRAPDPSQENGKSEIGIVQGNVSIERRWRSDFHAKNLDVYLRLTHQLLGESPTRLVIWPENAMNFFVESEPRHREAITSVLRAGGASLLAGGPSAGGDTSPPYYNSVFLIDGHEGVRARYDKEYLVPFSEYYPAMSLEWMRRRFEGARTFDAGPTSPGPIETAAGPVGVLICNEAMLPEVARERVLAGAEWLVSPSNDSWIRGRAFGEHMLAVVALRAIEQRRYLARASTAGPSALIDPWGRVVARTAPGVAASLRAAVRPLRGTTLYAEFGDTFAGLCLLVACGVLIATAVRERARPG